MDAPGTIDLRSYPAAHLAGMVLSHLRTLVPGAELRLLAPADPGWALRSADLHLQHRLDWTCTRRADGAWEAAVRYRDAGGERDVVRLLVEDHRRLDTLLAGALSALNAGDRTAGAQAFNACAAALRRHVVFEDDVLSPRLSGDVSAEAANLMSAEHKEIEAQLAAIEQALDEGEQGLGEAAILCGMLSGLMAKHEYREESVVFPLWTAALARRGEPERAALVDAARAQLGA
jgi:hypothetical protein